MTGFRRGVPLINLNEGTPVPPGFIVQLADELTPAHITNGLRQRVVFHHVLDRQTLDAHHLVFVNDARAELVLVVSPTISDTSMNTSDFETGFGPVLAALLFPGKTPLGLRQVLLITGEVFGIANLLPCRERHHRLDAQVKPDRVENNGKGLDLLLDQDRDEVAVGAIFGDRDRTGLASFGQRAMPDNLQRGIHLGKGGRRGPGDAGLAAREQQRHHATRGTAL